MAQVVTNSPYFTELRCSSLPGTGNGAQLTSCPMGTGGYYPGIKWPESEADNLSPVSAEIKNACCYNSTVLTHFHGILLN